MRAPPDVRKARIVGHKQSLETLVGRLAPLSLLLSGSLMEEDEGCERGRKNLGQIIEEKKKRFRGVARYAEAKRRGIPYGWDRQRK